MLGHGHTVIVAGAAAIGGDLTDFDHAAAEIGYRRRLHGTREPAVDRPGHRATDDGRRGDGDTPIKRRADLEGVL
jgi:hypothetical protein